MKVVQSVREWVVSQSADQNHGEPSISYAYALGIEKSGCGKTMGNAEERRAEHGKTSRGKKLQQTRSESRD